MLGRAEFMGLPLATTSIIVETFGALIGFAGTVAGTDVPGVGTDVFREADWITDWVSSPNVNPLTG